MKGYKAFKKGLICKDKQYAENTVYEEDEAAICEKGMHFCKNPLDVMDFYPLVDNNGDMTEFAEVEALDEAKTNDNKKYCTKKLKVGAKLSLAGFIAASVDFLFDRTKDAKVDNGHYAKLASSGYGAKLASSGDGAQLASSGDGAKLASSGYGAKLASSGNYAKLASSGNRAKLASSGDDAQLASSGHYAKLASSGHYAKLASSGNHAKLASSGNHAKLASSGEYSVVCAVGLNSIAKASVGSWITLAEYDENYIVKKVVTKQVDGDKIKADTFYQLKNGKFKEVTE